MTYSEKSMRVALDPSVAVMVLSNPECTDVELLPLRPRLMTAIERAQLATRWAGRNLDSIGVIGLVGTTPQCALKIPLEPEQVSALANAFLAYVHALLGESFAAQTEAVEIAELERMYLLPDIRSEA